MSTDLVLVMTVTITITEDPAGTMRRAQIGPLYEARRDYLTLTVAEVDALTAAQTQFERCFADAWMIEALRIGVGRGLDVIALITDDASRESCTAGPDGRTLEATIRGEAHEATTTPRYGRYFRADHALIGGRS